MTSTKPYDISRRRVLEAYQRVRANHGAAGIDAESIEEFAAQLDRNLYKLWNRMASGSYFPPPVRQVEIPKKQGGVRILGVPTVADRVAQQVVKQRIEGELEGLFHPDSYGYRPHKSAVEAVAVNLYMHYAFDAWMQREYPRTVFARYADDAVVHCRSESEAQALLAAIQERLKQCKLVMHPEKSGVVYCQDRKPRPGYPRIQFTFLGYTFRPRQTRGRQGKASTGFLPGVSEAAIKDMYREIRKWRVPRQTSVGLSELARRYNPILRGWLSYYGHFYKSALRRVFDHFDRRLVRWAQRKYRTLAGHAHRSHAWLKKMTQRVPRLFCHWLAFGKVKVRTMGAV